MKNKKIPAFQRLTIGHSDYTYLIKGKTYGEVLSEAKEHVYHLYLVTEETDESYSKEMSEYAAYIKFLTDCQDETLYEEFKDFVVETQQECDEAFPSEEFDI